MLFFCNKNYGTQTFILLMLSQTSEQVYNKGRYKIDSFVLEAVHTVYNICLFVTNIFLSFTIYLQQTRLALDVFD